MCVLLGLMFSYIKASRELDDDGNWFPLQTSCLLNIHCGFFNMLIVCLSKD